MENFTVTTQTDLTLLDDRAALDGDSNGLVAHEAAHTWFGNVVTAKTGPKLGCTNPLLPTLTLFIPVSQKEKTNLDINYWKTRKLILAKIVSTGGQL